MNKITLYSSLYTRLLFLFVGISGATAVLLGAWLAHGGQSLTPLVQARMQAAWFYQFIHTFALFVVLLWYQQRGNKGLLIACFGFFMGILAFSGSLYVKTFLSFAPIGKIAPLGGITFALSWLIIAFVGFKNK